MTDKEVRRRRPIHEDPAGPGEYRNNKKDDSDEVLDYRTGCGTLCKIILVVFIILPLCGLLLVAILVPSPIQPQVLNLKPAKPLEGVLEPNDHLKKTEYLFEGEVRGPESLIFRNGVFYTGTADGRVVEIKDGVIRNITTFGKPPCGTEELEPTCGRPLGMRFDKDGYLIVLDGYLGLFKVDVKSGKSEVLLSSEKDFGKERPRLLNDLDIASDGTIYFTDSSTKWERRFNRYCILEAGDHGRLFKYDPKTKAVEILMTQLRFPNGVQLGPKEEFLLIVETTSCKIHRYYLKGPQKDQIHTFAENLPGLPDNIRPSSTGGYWVGMASVRDPSRLFDMYDFAARRPWLRKFITQLIPQSWIIKAVKPYGLIIELNKDGDIVRSLHDPKAEVISQASEIEDHDGVLYIGSYFAPYIGKLDLKKL